MTIICVIREMESVMILQFVEILQFSKVLISSELCPLRTPLGVKVEEGGAQSATQTPPRFNIYIYIIYIIYNIYIYIYIVNYIKYILICVVKKY